jgi:hypothetical protein
LIKILSGVKWSNVVGKTILENKTPALAIETFVMSYQDRNIIFKTGKMVYAVIVYPQIILCVPK